MIVALKVLAVSASATRETIVHAYFWNNLYFGWGGFLCFSIILLLFSSMGHGRYTYAVRRRYRLEVPAHKNTLDMLNKRYPVKSYLNNLLSVGEASALVVESI